MGLNKTKNIDKNSANDSALSLLLLLNHINSNSIPCTSYRLSQLQYLFQTLYKSPYEFEYFPRIKGIKSNDFESAVGTLIWLDFIKYIPNSECLDFSPEIKLLDAGSSYLNKFSDSVKKFEEESKIIVNRFGNIKLAKLMKLSLTLYLLKRNEEYLSDKEDETRKQLKELYCFKISDEEITQLMKEISILNVKECCCKEEIGKICFYTIFNQKV